MSLTLFLLFIPLVVLIIIIAKNQLMQMGGENNNLVLKLQNANWFQNKWKSGLFLFGMNASLFFISCLCIYLIMFLLIPFLHLFVMLFAVIGSVYMWIIINNAWQGTNKNRIILGLVGSSFYVIMSLIFLYKIVNLKPSYPGEDTFMSFIGLAIAIVVTTVAFITCLIFTGFSKKKAEGFIK
ncbi:hypothetical protein [Gottfriedia luciferensis]|uniref:hypothetical protein n=1 Tax=Gottfriedia luciferensis TaxID=178774 RepID=UPI000B432F9C|nr:hypothetical protein [Gottfriedia luciferensis]